ncbi:MAG: S-adenosylmethionine:tRNA ribosyltransferase-isomerase, partial [Tidjanibacter sp.]|nr:S-adenosylmethionine:tRNA ribosyltransferase-isomerase [Tidjanibacter sp.]
MKLSQYSYDFSADLLAKYPTEDRDESRLLVLHRNTGEIEHRVFKDILDYFEEKDVFVFNN